jgi:hypothetical protein
MKHLITIISLLLSIYNYTTRVYGQTSATALYTDFNGFWTSSCCCYQSIKPDNAHNLLAITVPSGTYSTGVNDVLLTANSVSFIPQLFEAVPLIQEQTGTLMGVGLNAPPPTSYGKYFYLTDGIQGLDISTALFNQSGNMKYMVSGIEESSINDGIPDFIVPQMGQAGIDQFRFEDASGNIVGNQVNINFSSVCTIDSLRWAFYQFITPPTPTPGGSSNGGRGMKILTFEISDFGIDASNYANITHFVHVANGASDPPFVAYNLYSIVILPITLVNFDARMTERQKVELTWTTEAEINNDFFTIERTTNGQQWETVSIIKGKGNTTNTTHYETIDHQALNGTSYYRLYQTDFNGKKSYSNIVAVNLLHEGIRIYPNPAKSIVSIEGNKIEAIKIINVIGQDVTDTVSFVNQSKNFVQLDISLLKNGIYFIQHGNEIFTIAVQ